MHPSAKGAGSFIEGIVGALTTLAVFAIIGLLALVVGVGTGLYFLAVWLAPYAERLYDAVMLTAAGV